MKYYNGTDAHFMPNLSKKVLSEILKAKNFIKHTTSNLKYFGGIFISEDRNKKVLDILNICKIFEGT